MGLRPGFGYSVKAVKKIVLGVTVLLISCLFFCPAFMGRLRLAPLYPRSKYIHLGNGGLPDLEEISESASPPHKVVVASKKDFHWSRVG